MNNTGLIFRLLIPIIVPFAILMAIVKIFDFLSPYLPFIFVIVFFIPTVKGFQILYKRIQEFVFSIINFRKKYKSYKEYKKNFI